MDLDELEADIENRLEDAIEEQNKIQANLSTSDAVAVSDAWNLLYNSEQIMEDMRDTVVSINTSIGEMYAVETGNGKSDFTSMLDFTFNTNALIEAYATSNTDNVSSHLGQLQNKFNTLRDAANFLAQSSVELKAIQERVAAGDSGKSVIEEEMEAALKLIEESDVYKDNEELRELLLADCQNRITNVTEYIAEIVEGCEKYTKAGTGEDYLNSESDLYFMNPIDEAVNTYFEAKFEEIPNEDPEDPEELNDYVDVYKKHKHNLEGVDVAVELAKIKKELLSVCPITTISEEYIFAQIESSKDSEDEEDTMTGPTNNNRIVVVTYGDRDANTFEKTAYKSIILNYNSYDVRVTYENPLVEGDEPTLYTIPSGGYIVIIYD